MSLPVHLVESLAGVAPGSVVEVTGDEAHHAVAVRRLREGEQVVLTDGLGTSVTGSVASTGKRVFAVAVESVSHDDRPAPAITVVQALPKGDRGELAVEVLTEVGVDRIVPWAASRSVAVWKGERAAKSHAKWQATAREAGEAVAPLVAADRHAAGLDRRPRGPRRGGRPRGRPARGRDRPAQRGRRTHLRADRRGRRPRGRDLARGARRPHGRGRAERTTRRRGPAHLDRRRRRRRRAALAHRPLGLVDDRDPPGVGVEHPAAGRVVGLRDHDVVAGGDVGEVEGDRRTGRACPRTVPAIGRLSGRRRTVPSQRWIRRDDVALVRSCRRPFTVNGSVVVDHQTLRRVGDRDVGEHVEVGRGRQRLGGRDAEDLVGPARRRAAAGQGSGPARTSAWAVRTSCSTARPGLVPRSSRRGRSCRSPSSVDRDELLVHRVRHRTRAPCRPERPVVGVERGRRSVPRRARRSPPTSARCARWNSR